MKKYIVPALLVTLSACDITVERINPAVSQFNGDSVSIQLDGNLMELAPEDIRAAALAQADEEAARICQRGQKKRAEFTSTRRLQTAQYAFVIERLYLCLN